MSNYLTGVLAGILLLYILVAQGCNGFLRYDGKGFPYSIDGQKHHFKLELND